MRAFQLLLVLAIRAWRMVFGRPVRHVDITVDESDDISDDASDATRIERVANHELRSERQWAMLRMSKSGRHAHAVAFTNAGERRTFRVVRRCGSDVRIQRGTHGPIIRRQLVGASN